MPDTTPTLRPIAELEAEVAAEESKAREEHAKAVLRQFNNDIQAVKRSLKSFEDSRSRFFEDYAAGKDVYNYFVPNSPARAANVAPKHGW